MTFEIVEPSTLSEALSLLNSDEPSVRPFAGGTALMLMMKSGIYHPSKLVVLRRLDGFSSIRNTENDSLTIGSMATLTSLEQSSVVAAHAPVLTKALRHLSNRRVRNVARLGGALAHGDPHMDLPPLLAALDAVVAVVGPSGERTIKVADLVTGYYETSLASNELIREICIPSQKGWSSSYLKFTARSAEDWPALGIAASLRVEDGVIVDLRLVVGAATERPIRLTQAEAVLRGTTGEKLAQAGEIAAAAIDPLDDSHGSAEYKRALLRVQLGRAVAIALKDVK